MTLSAAECQALEGLVRQWLDLGAGDEEVVRALTGGLPLEVHSAGALARRRLVDKMPPERAPEPSSLRPLRILECTVCRTPGRPEALPGGLCRDCRSGGPAYADHRPDPAVVRARADGIRRLVRAAARATALPS
ncbi:hypothetical protein ABZY03_20365 [Streptomyces klenkii]|uniref:hypothetical protein n=1 Tax=Streptomyces klenkii TaxID=1420899 RepID=UPI0033A1DC5C